MPTGIFVIISILVSQMLDNVIFTPLIQSKGLKLHPVTVIIALLVFGKFFGIIGMIIAAPCVAIIKTVKSDKNTITLIFYKFLQKNNLKFMYFNDKYELIKLNEEIEEEVEKKTSE